MEWKNYYYCGKEEEDKKSHPHDCTLDSSGNFMLEPNSYGGKFPGEARKKDYCFSKDMIDKRNEKLQPPSASSTKTQGAEAAEAAAKTSEAQAPPGTPVKADAASSPNSVAAAPNSIPAPASSRGFANRIADAAASASAALKPVRAAAGIVNDFKFELPTPTAPDNYTLVNDDPTKYTPSEGKWSNTGKYFTGGFPKCAESCNTDPDCKSFTYYQTGDSKNGENCKLMDKHIKETDMKMSSTKENRMWTYNKSTPPITPTNFILVTDPMKPNKSGGRSGRWSKVNFNKCASGCQENPKCRSFTHYQNGEHTEYDPQSERKYSYNCKHMEEDIKLRKMIDAQNKNHRMWTYNKSTPPITPTNFIAATDPLNPNTYSSKEGRGVQWSDVNFNKCASECLENHKCHSFTYYQNGDHTVYDQAKGGNLSYNCKYMEEKNDWYSLEPHSENDYIMWTYNKEDDILKKDFLDKLKDIPDHETYLKNIELSTGEIATLEVLKKYPWETIKEMGLMDQLSIVKDKLSEVKDKLSEENDIKTKFLDRIFDKFTVQGPWKNYEYVENYLMRFQMKLIDKNGNMIEKGPTSRYLFEKLNIAGIKNQVEQIGKSLDMENCEGENQLEVCVENIKKKAYEYFIANTTLTGYAKAQLKAAWDKSMAGFAIEGGKKLYDGLKNVFGL